MTKNRILETAIRLFTEEGYDKVSMREIALAANMTKPALYYHYESKEAIVRTYLEEFFEHHRQMNKWVQGAQKVSSEAFVEKACSFAQEQSPETLNFIRRNHRIVKAIGATGSNGEDIENFGEILAKIVSKEWGLSKPNVAVEMRVRMVLLGIFSSAQMAHENGNTDEIFTEVQHAAKLLLSKPEGT